MDLSFEDVRICLLSGEKVRCDDVNDVASRPIADAQTSRQIMCVIRCECHSDGTLRVPQRRPKQESSRFRTPNTDIPFP